MRFFLFSFFKEYRFLLLHIFFGVGAIFYLFTNISLADGVLPSGWDENIESAAGLSGAFSGDDAVEKIDSLLRYNIIPIFRYVFIGIGLLFLMTYAYILLFNNGDEDQFSNQRKNVLYAFLGFSLMGIAPEFSSVFDPARSDASDLGNLSQFDETIDQIITFVQSLLGVIALAMSTYAAVMMIAYSEDEEEVKKGRLYFVYAFLGFVIVLLAEPLVNTVFYPERGAAGVGDRQISNFVIQFIGVLQFILQIVGGLIFILFLASGFLFLTARDDEEQQEKAKKILLWSAIGIVVIVVSYPLLRFFIPS